MIAERIQERKAEKTLETTFELAEIIKDCYPPQINYAFLQQAKARVFQAIRIEVNDEVDHLLHLD